MSMQDVLLVWFTNCFIMYFNVTPQLPRLFLQIYFLKAKQIYLVVANHLNVIGGSHSLPALISVDMLN